MADAILMAVNVILLVAAATSVGLWIHSVRHWLARSDRDVGFLESIVPVRPHTPPFWTLAEVLVMLGMMILFGSLATSCMIQLGWMPRPTTEPGKMTVETLLASTWASTIAGLSAASVLIAWLRLFRSSDGEIGLSVTRSDVVLGLKSALMLLPPVLLISGIVNQFVPYEHPVLDLLAKLSTPGVMATIFMGTAVVAPFVEELFFRVILQGALQSLADRSDPEDANWRPRAYWPILISSMVFAALHSGQGAAPVPLFMLALGLGYLYRQTGRITAPLVVHMVLNGLTLAVEFLKLST